MTLHQYFIHIQEKIKNKDFKILKINRNPENDFSVYLESINYLMWEFWDDHKDKRTHIFDYVIIPNDSDFDFTSITFEDFFKFLSSVKSKEITMINCDKDKQSTKTVKKVTKDVPKPTTKKSILMEKVKILETKLETLKEQMKISILEIKSEISLLKTEISNMEDVELEETKQKPIQKPSQKVEKKVEPKVEKKVEPKIEKFEPIDTNARTRGKHILGQHEGLEVELTITDKKSELRYNDDVYRLPLNLSQNIELKDAIEYINNENLLDETLSNISGIKYSNSPFGQSINNVKIDNNIKNSVIKLCKNKDKFDDKQFLDEIKKILN